MFLFKWRIPIHKHISLLKVALVLPAIALFFYGCNLSESSCTDCEPPVFYTIYAINPNGTLQWNYTIKNGAPGLPAIGHDGTLYFYAFFPSMTGGSSRLYAMSPTGTVDWEKQLPVSYWDNSSPVVGGDGTIYLSLNVFRTLYAFNPDGALTWTYVTNHPSEYLSSPVIGADGTIYVTDNSSLYALNPTGALRWSYSTGTNDSQPAIGINNTIYIEGDEGMLYAFTSTGTLNFSSPVMNYTNYTSFASPPVIGPDGTIYITMGDNIAHTLDAMNPYGTYKWSYEIGPYVVFSSYPIIGSDGTIYLSLYNATPDQYILYAINPTGGIQWSYTWAYTTNTSFGSPAISMDGTIYITFDNKLFAINTNGKIKWQYAANGMAYISPVVAPDGTIYFSSQHN